MAMCAQLVMIPSNQPYSVSNPPVYGLQPQGYSSMEQCAYVIQSGTEYSAGWNQLMYMSVDDAQVIGTYIGMVWAIAWGFRAIRMAIFSPSERYDHE